MGITSSYDRTNRTYYYHGKTKIIFVKPLHKKARQILSAEILTPELVAETAPLVDLNKVNLTGQGGFLEYLGSIRDESGVTCGTSRYPYLAVTVHALLVGMKAFFIAIGEWVANLSQDILKSLGCWYSDRLRRYVQPNVPTIRRTLQVVDSEDADAVIDSIHRFTRK